MKTLLIDSYDSFTFNLYQYLAEVNSEPPLVVHNDTAPWDEIAELELDNIVIPPGPGRPEVERDFGICRRAILEATVPVLGVCLGHQGLCHLFGGKVDYAMQVMHGRPSLIRHTGADVFAGLPSPFTAIRYHSLHVPVLSDELEGLAWMEDSMLMGVRHRTRPIWGVQFHPESIGTEFGQRILDNFRELTVAHRPRNPPRRRSSERSCPHRSADAYTVVPAARTTTDGPGARALLHGKHFAVHYRRLRLRLDAEQVFINLYAEACPAFWLDSALVRDFSRFSYMGDVSGPHAEFISCDLLSKQVSVTHRGGTTTHEKSIFSFLDRQLRERHVETEGLPVDFNGGYVGYLGYELKAECGADAAHVSPTPDAAFVFADRFIAFDHEENVVYLVCLDDEEHVERARDWLQVTSARLKLLEPVPQWSRALRPQRVRQTFRHTPERYLELIAECQKEIKKGESYEVCLTNMISNDVRIDP